MSPAAPYIAIAGNIGAGKSSFVSFLAHHYDVDAIEEPNATNPFLVRFYRDMPRWAFHSQVYFLSAKVGLQRTIGTSQRPIVHDRTLWEDGEIFAAHLARRGCMDPDEFRTYRTLFDELSQTLRPPDLLIYLRCPHAVLRRRIRRRGRSEEQALPRGYLAALEALYDAWYDAWTLSPKWVLPTDRIDPVADVLDHADILARMDPWLTRRTPTG
jgi:deoxyadenosine/deoxycytidine kinase